MYSIKTNNLRSKIKKVTNKEEFSYEILYTFDEGSKVRYRTVEKKKNLYQISALTSNLNFN